MKQIDVAEFQPGRGQGVFHGPGRFVADVAENGDRFHR
jgi:hypothetical protein